MSHPIVIDLKLTGVQQVTSGLQRTQKAIQQLNGGGSGINVGNASGLRNYTTGNARAWAWQQRQIQMQQRQQNAAAQRMARMAGGVGTLGALGEIATKVSAILGATRVLNEVFSGAAREAESFQKSMYSAPGVGAAGAARMDALEKYSGAGAAQWYEMQRNLKQAGVVTSELRKYGIGVSPSPYEDLNPERIANQIPRWAHNKNIPQRSKDVVYSQYPWLRQFQDMSDDDFNKLMKENKWGMSPENQNTNRSQAARFDRWWEKFSSGMNPKRWAMDMIDALNGKNFQPQVYGAAGGGGRPQESKLEKLTKAIEANTQAARDNTALIKNGRGVGGGDRARGMPTAAWSHMVIQSEAERQSIQMGAYRSI